MEFINKLLCLSFAALPLFSYAEDFKIVNNIAYDLSFRVDGNCADGFGTAQSGTITTIPAEVYKKEISNCEYCDVTVYWGANCRGVDIARIGLGPDGIFYFDEYAGQPKINITGHGFNLSFSYAKN